MSISESRIKELERAESKLRALESGGVDNWEYYGESLSGYYRQVSFEDEITEIILEIATILLEGAFEPSEHGAGYATTDEAITDAEKYLASRAHDIMAPDGDK